MNDEKFEKYLEGRYSDQVNWYDRKSARNKKFYCIFQWSVIVLSATLPVLVVSLSNDHKWISATLAVILAIGTAGLKTFKLQENWINYRTMAETLRKEKYFYDAGIDDYSDPSGANALFVERVEALISREHSLWITVHQPKDKKESEQSRGVL